MLSKWAEISLVFLPLFLPLTVPDLELNFTDCNTGKYQMFWKQLLSIKKLPQLWTYQA
jgi:hypothetical protein